jgi:CRISPR-associated protein Csb3
VRSTSPIELRFDVNPTNPGQFFACCGLFECAFRLWGKTTRAAFANQGREFVLAIESSTLDIARKALADSLLAGHVTNIMTPDEVARLDQLTAMKKKDLEAADLGEERKSLEALRREAPVVLGDPLHLTIDWHKDSRGGGSTFKTWAGQQSIIDIAQGMQRALAETRSSNEFDASLLRVSSCGGGLPFNFDSDLGGQGAALDVGFSFDPLGDLKVAVRPAIELLAFVGLQRFRPRRTGKENRYTYCAWTEPLPICVAPSAACGAVRFPGDRAFEFRLLYRTKYLKSFLPAKQL